MQVGPYARVVLSGALAASLSLGCLGCSKKSDPGKSTTVEFSKVPLDVQLPPGWSQAQNTAEWIVYRPGAPGAFVAMSGERSCTLVEKRLYSALMELSLDQVVWQTAPQQTSLQGLRATLAEGTAMEAQQRTRLKYSLVHAQGNMGCLVTLVGYWQSKEQEYGAAADQIVRAVKARE